MSLLACRHTLREYGRVLGMQRVQDMVEAETAGTLLSSSSIAELRDAVCTHATGVVYLPCQDNSMLTHVK